MQISMQIMQVKLVRKLACKLCKLSTHAPIEVDLLSKVSIRLSQREQIIFKFPRHLTRLPVCDFVVS